MTTVKITELTDIGANLATSTVVPVVNMAGTPTTQKTNIGNIANIILEGAGVDYPEASVALLAQTVSNAAQPNITSVGTLTTLAVSGNASVNGNLTSNGTAYLGNISTTGSATITTLIVGTTANLGAVANVRITGGTAGQVLSTDGAGNLSWASDATTYSNSNVAAYLPTYTGNIGANAVTANLFVGSGANLTNLAGANVSGTVGLATYATTANAVAGANVSGFVPNANVANTAFAVAAANVTGLGNIATINLTGSTSNILYGNGVFAPASGGGNVSELVNGNNSFVLDSAGNVVFEGTPSGNAVDRGLVWDYGANANGVNSMVRQDNNGITVRAYTVDGGGANGYSAPVNIVTNQDATENTWTFDGQGNLTVPSGSINSINDGGSLGAYITLTPDLGFAKLAARDTQTSVNYTNTSWSTGTYTGTQIDFTNAPDLVAFFNNNRFNVGVNQTFSINGDEPVPFTGYTVGSSNAVTVYTSVTASPDPTTVTSINFYYQLESYVSVDYDDGSLNINATGLTIYIDNDQTEGPDINIRSGDDITLQAKDTSLGSEREGGDINLFAGDGSDDDGQGNTSSTGGDILITAGNGGDGNSGSGSAGGFTQIYGGTGGAAGVTNTAGPGGYVSINGGDGGSDTGNTQLGAGGGYVSISAGLSTQEGVNGPNVTITSGQGGPNALAGSVVISTPASADGPGGDWVFDGAGNLILANGNSVIQSIANSSLDPTLPNVSTMVFTPDANYNSQVLVLDPTAPGHIHLRAFSPSNIDAPAANIFLGGEDTSFEVTQGANNQAVIHSGGYDWTFGNDGTLTVPFEGVIRSFDDTIVLQSVDTGTGNANSVRLATDGSLYFEGTEYLNGWFQIANDSGNANIVSPSGNISITPAFGVANAAGKSLNLQGGAADQSDFYTGIGGAVNITGGLGSSDDGGGGGPGGNVNITSGNSSDPAGHAGNINITAGSNDWIFDYNGTLTLPGNLVYIGASPAPSINGFGSANFAGNVAGGNISTTGNISGNTNGYTIGYLNIPQVAASNTTIALSDAGKHYYSTTAGNFTLTVPNNATTAFATGTAISIVVQAAGNILVNADAGVTLYMAGNSTAANRVVGGYGMATLMKVGTDTWFINGTGVS